MELVLNATKSPLLTLTPSGGNFFVFGDVLVYVMHPGNSSDKQLAFVLGSVSTIDNWTMEYALWHLTICCMRVMPKRIIITSLYYTFLCLPYELDRLCTPMPLSMLTLPTTTRWCVAILPFSSKKMFRVHESLCIFMYIYPYIGLQHTYYIQYHVFWL